MIASLSSSSSCSGLTRLKRVRNSTRQVLVLTSSSIDAAGTVYFSWLLHTNEARKVRITWTSSDDVAVAEASAKADNPLILPLQPQELSAAAPGPGSITLSGFKYVYSSTLGVAVSFTFRIETFAVDGATVESTLTPASLSTQKYALIPKRKVYYTFDWYDATTRKFFDQWSRGTTYSSSESITTASAYTTLASEVFGGTGGSVKFTGAMSNATSAPGVKLPAMSFTNEGFSVSMWVKMLGSLVDFPAIVFQLNSTPPKLVCQNGRMNWFQSGAFDVSTNTWHHLVLTLFPNSDGTSTTANVYLNNVQILTDVVRASTYSQYPFSATGGYLGANSPGTTSFTFNGLIDEFRCYNCVLVKAQVEQLFLARTAESEVLPGQARQVGYRMVRWTWAPQSAFGTSVSNVLSVKIWRVVAGVLYLPSQITGYYASIRALSSLAPAAVLCGTTDATVEDFTLQFTGCDLSAMSEMVITGLAPGTSYLVEMSTTALGATTIYSQQFTTLSYPANYPSDRFSIAWSPPASIASSPTLYYYKPGSTSLTGAMPANYLSESLEPAIVAANGFLVHKEGATGVITSEYMTTTGQLRFPDRQGATPTSSTTIACWGIQSDSWLKTTTALSFEKDRTYVFAAMTTTTQPRGQSSSVRVFLDPSPGMDMSNSIGTDCIFSTNATSNDGWTYQGYKYVWSAPTGTYYLRLVGMHALNATMMFSQFAVYVE